MTKERAIELLISHLRQCAELMPTEWIDKNGSGELMEAFEMAFDALQKQAEYEDMEEQGRLVVLPCKVGDLLWGIRWFGVNAKVQQAPVTVMRFLDDMTLSITLGKVCSGEYGKGVFLTREEAEQALKGGANQ